MSISLNTKITNYYELNQKDYSKVNNNEQNKEPEATSINNAVSLSLSSEAITLSETNNLGQIKNLNLPESSIRMVNFQIKLSQEMKTQRIAGQSTGDNIKDLANAYATILNNLNENSETSQKHSKFLNDAFKAVSDYHFTQSAQQQIKNESFTQSLQTGVVDSNLRDVLNKAAEDAKKQSALFSESFLKNFKKLGLDGAYNLAISLI